MGGDYKFGLKPENKHSHLKKALFNNLIFLVFDFKYLALHGIGLYFAFTNFDQSCTSDSDETNN